MTRLVLCYLIFPCLMFAATTQRDWKAGKVAADSYISIPEYAKSAPRHTADDPNIVIIRGGDYIYTAEERHAWSGWCLLIQGDEIKYFQDNHKLDIIDADGDKCRLDILKQEKRP